MLHNEIPDLRERHHQLTQFGIAVLASTKGAPKLNHLIQGPVPGRSDHDDKPLVGPGLQFGIAEHAKRRLKVGKPRQQQRSTAALHMKSRGMLFDKAVDHFRSLM